MLYELIINQSIHSFQTHNTKLFISHNHITATHHDLITILINNIIKLISHQLIYSLSFTNNTIISILYASQT